MKKQYLSIALAALATSTYAAKPKMNVLLLVIDDLRPELNCYGDESIVTPNIDKLASNGVLFHRAYCNIPVSGASRASLMTGIRPGVNRFYDVEAKISEDAPEAITLPMLFNNNGYNTFSNIKFYH